MSDIFISYSRKDIAYARLLHNALSENDFETWIDWQDIPPSTEWLQEVFGAIEEANTFIFILSASSVLSDICKKEIEHASKNNKRIIPIVVDDVEPSKVHPTLAAINWIFSRTKDELEPAIKSLIEAIQTDYDWVKAHTRLQVRALEWERAEKDKSFLLQGTDLHQAENWLAESVDKEPEPTLQQTRYIQSSRQGAVQRQRRLLLSVGAALVVTIILGVFAVINGQRAVQQRGIAEQNADSLATQVVIAKENAELAHIRELTAVSQQDETRNDIAMLLGIESFNTIENYQTTDNLFKLSQSHPELLGIANHERVHKIAISPDGKQLISGSNEGSVIHWDIVDGQILFRKELLTFGYGPDNSINFSFDGKMLTTGIGDGRIIFWDTSTFERKSAIQTGSGINAHAFNPDGTLLASFGELSEGNRYIRLWDVATGESIVSSIPGITGWKGEIVFSPDGSFFAAGKGNLLIVDTASGEIITDLMENKTHTTLCVDISPDGTILASAGEDNRITFWDTRNFEQMGESFGEFDSAVNGLAFSPDGSMLAAGSWDTSIQLFDVATREPVGAPLGSHQGRVYDVAFSPDGKTLFSASEDGTIIHWDLQSYGIPAELVSSTNQNVTMGSLSENGKTLAVLNDDYDIILHDTFSGQPISDPLQGSSESILRIAYSPDGDKLVSVGEYGSVIFWDVPTASMIGTPQRVYDCGPELLLYCVDTIFAFSPDGSTLASSIVNEKKGIILWDVSTGQQIGKPFAEDVRWINDLVFSPDGQSLAVGYEGGSCLYDVANRVRISNQHGWHPDWTNRVAFNPDGDIFASAGGGTIMFWDEALKQPLSEPISASMDWFNQFKFSPTGDILATASVDGSIMFVDAINMLPIGYPVSLPRSFGGIVSLAFTEDSSALISLQADGTLLSWNITQTSWKENLCNRVGRNFTREEWEQYFPDESYRKTCEQWPEGD